MKILQDKFATWFTSRLLSAPLHEHVDPETQPEEFDRCQKAAIALGDKIDWMTCEENTHSDMDSVIRMLCRICDKGTKPIPDHDKMVDENARYHSHTGSFTRQSYKRAVAGFGKTIGHFRWNHSTVYSLHPIYVKELIKILREIDYFSLKPDAVMFTHEIEDE